MYLATGIILGSGGGTALIQGVYDTGEDSERVRVIVTNDGKHQGAGRTANGGFSSRGASVMDPDHDFVMNPDSDFQVDWGDG